MIEKRINIHQDNLIDSDNNMYLTVDLLIDKKSIITGLNNITLKKGNVKSYGRDKMYIDKDLIEGKLYQLIDQFNERRILNIQTFFVIFDNTNPFYD